MKYLVLFEQDHFHENIQKLYKILKIDKLIVLSPFCRNCDKLKEIYKSSKVQNIEIFVLDYRDLIIQHVLSYSQKENVNITYIQHGYFEKNINRRLLKRSYKWFIKSFIYLIVYSFKSYREHNFLMRLSIGIDYLKNGAQKAIQRVSQNKIINNVFLINNKSIDIFKSEFRGQYNNLKVIGKLDEECFKFSENGEVIYVTQPLHLTNHVSRKEYIEYINSLSESYRNLIILLHPKIENDFIENLKSKKFIYKKQILEYSYRLVIGHFSTILIGIDKKIELKLVSKIGNSRLNEVDHFDPYDSTQINAFDFLNDYINR